MSNIAFRMFEHLLPRGMTWRLLLGKQLRQFFEGLANGVPTDVIAKADARWDDMDPALTLQLDEFDDQFGLPLSAGLTDAERRSRILGAWRNTGGQGKEYLEQVLVDHGFPGVFLHEFWEPGLTTFDTETVLSVDDVGNATGLSLPPSPGNTTINIGHLGGPVKVTALARFELDIPKDARIVAAELRITIEGTTAGATPGNTTKVGVFLKDGKWDIPANGWDSPPYIGLNDIPDPTDSGTSAINPGVLQGNRFIPGGEFDWDDTTPAFTIISIGHESFDPTAVCDLAAEIQTWIDDPSYDPTTAPYIGFVWDDASASEDVNNYTIYASDAVVEGPRLTVIWEPKAVQPITVKNPNTYLADGGPTSATCCDEALMECDEAIAECGETIGARGELLVNKVETSTTIFLGCGEALMECDEAQALCGEPLSVTFGRVKYLIPTDVEEWRYILYVGAEVWPQSTSVEMARQEEFENLLLGIAPGQQWLGMLVDYV